MNEELIKYLLKQFRDYWMAQEEIKVIVQSVEDWREPLGQSNVDIMDMIGANSSASLLD